MKRFFVVLLSLVLLTVLFACGGGSGSSSPASSGSGTSNPTPSTPTPATPPPSASNPYSISGVIQKGPFILGSAIAINELDDTLTPNGTTYSVQTTDGLGNFTCPTIRTRYVEITGDGFYFDELSGALSTERVIMRAIADMTAETTPGVNIITTMQVDRIKNLMRAGSTYADASARSLNEVLAAFGISQAGLLPATQMRIGGTTESDSILLACSAVLLKMAQTKAGASGSAPAELASYLATIGQQIASSGTVAATITAERRAASQAINIASVRSNLETHYANQGVTLSVPKFQEWIDTAGTGTLPQRASADPTPFSFEPVAAADHTVIQTSNTVVMGGILAGTAVSLTGTGNIVKNGTLLSEGSTTAQDGDSFALRTTSGSFGQSKTVTLAVGNLSGDYTVTTRVPKIGYAYALEKSPGSCRTGRLASYYAFPIKPTTSFTGKYVAVRSNSSSNRPVNYSIHADDNGKPGSVLGSSINIANYFDTTLSYKYLDGSAVNANYWFLKQAYLGSEGVALTAGTKYWVVIQFNAGNELFFSYDSSIPVPHSGVMSYVNSTWTPYSACTGSAQIGPSVFISD